MENSVANNRFSVHNRRLELFCRQQENEDELEFLYKIQDLVNNSDWSNITEKEAVFMIFQKGVQCEQCRKVCSQFRKECPEGDIQRLADQLKGVMASKKHKTNYNSQDFQKSSFIRVLRICTRLRPQSRLLLSCFQASSGGGQE